VPRIARRTLNLTTLLLIVICLVAITALWLRSYHFGDWTILRTSGRCGGSIISDSGRLQLRVLRYDTSLGRTAASYGSYLILPPSARPVGFSEHWPFFDKIEERQLSRGPINDGGLCRLGFKFQSSDWVGTLSNTSPVPEPRFPRSYHHWTLVIPYWILFVAAAAPPTWRAVRAVHRRRSRRLQPGCCRKCGYDLRATPERCPECGLASV
jgi:hypothetical protein